MSNVFNYSTKYIDHAKKTLKLNLNNKDLEKLIKDFIVELEQYSSLLESNPEQLDELQSRLEMIKRLQRRNGLDLPQLIRRRDELRVSLEPGGLEKKLLEVIITTTCMIKNELLAIYAMVKVVFRIILNCAYRSTLKLNCYSRSIDFFLT